MADPTIVNSAVTKTFAEMDGRFRGLGERVEEITRHGDDGHSYQKGGQRAAASTYETVVDVANAAAATTEEAAQMALKGTVATITNRRGEVRTNMMIEEVEIISSHESPSISYKINGGSWVIRTRWTARKSS